ncbi:hypothetical protein EDB84DRAFT_1496472, partial [Lactarius hengduanensis]
MPWCSGGRKTIRDRIQASGDKRLTTLEITRSHLPAAEFAFLSTYDAAEVTGGSIMDEGLHLAATVQYAGFQSVVGTTWAMVDEDGHGGTFLQGVVLEFKTREGVPYYYERSAKAL